MNKVIKRLLDIGLIVIVIIGIAIIRSTPTVEKPECIIDCIVPCNCLDYPSICMETLKKLEDCRFQLHNLTK